MAKGLYEEMSKQMDQGRENRQSVDGGNKRIREELLAALALRMYKLQTSTDLHVETSRAAGQEIREIPRGSEWGHEYQFPKKCSSVEFPKFNGLNLRSWVFKCEQNFEIEDTPSEGRVEVVTMHLDGRALEWHRSFMKTRWEPLNWEEYKRALHDRFGSLLYEDPMYELASLKQIGNVTDYADKFELLLRNVDLPETYAVSYFLGGLKSEISLQISMFKPQTMIEVVSLAKLHEDALILLGNKNSNDFSLSMDYVVEIPPKHLVVDTTVDISSEGDSLAMSELVVFDEMPNRKYVGNHTKNVVNKIDELIVFEEMSEKGSIGTETENCTRELSMKFFGFEVQGSSTVAKSFENVWEKENTLMINEVEHDKFMFHSKEESPLIKVSNALFDQLYEENESMETKAENGTVKDCSIHLLRDSGWEVELLEGVVISVRLVPEVLRIRTNDYAKEDFRSTRVNIGLIILWQAYSEMELLPRTSNVWLGLLRPPPEPPPQGSRISRISTPLQTLGIKTVLEEAFCNTSKICCCPCFMLFYCHYQLYTLAGYTSNLYSELHILNGFDQVSRPSLQATFCSVLEDKDGLREEYCNDPKLKGTKKRKKGCSTSLSQIAFYLNNRFNTFISCRRGSSTLFLVALYELKCINGESSSPLQSDEK